MNIIFKPLLLAIIIISTIVIFGSIRYITNQTISFKDFEASLPREPLRNNAYIVEGDIPIFNKEDLEKYYNDTILPRMIIVHTIDSTQDVWDDETKENLTYCINNDFGDRLKPTIVRLMEDAANAWESVIDVDFIYKPDQDNNCDPASNSNIIFSVNKVSNRAYFASAPSPSFPPEDRKLFINIDSFSSYNNSSKEKFTGLFIHELGHILGFQHEHIRPEAISEAGALYDCDPEEDVEWEALTEYDPHSIMHFAISEKMCNGEGVDFKISYLDAIGARKVYGAPEKPWIHIYTPNMNYVPYINYRWGDPSKIIIAGNALDNKSISNVRLHIISNNAGDVIDAHMYGIKNEAGDLPTAHWYAEIQRPLSLTNLVITAYAVDSENNESEPYVYNNESVLPLELPLEHYVYFDYPHNNSVISALEVEAHASLYNFGLTDVPDPDIRRVDFYVDGLRTHSDTQAPYTFDWDIGNYKEIPHVLMVRAYKQPAIGQKGIGDGVILVSRFATRAFSSIPEKDGYWAGTFFNLWSDSILVGDAPIDDNSDTFIKHVGFISFDLDAFSDTTALLKDANLLLRFNFQNNTDFNTGFLMRYIENHMRVQIWPPGNEYSVKMLYNSDNGGCFFEFNDPAALDDLMRYGTIYMYLHFPINPEPHLFTIYSGDVEDTLRKPRLFLKFDNF